MAWLHATPEKWEMPRYKAYDDPDMPHLGYGAHLVNILFSFREISYTEIAHSPFNSELMDVEKIMLISLSKAYDMMRDKARKPACPAPFVDYSDPEKNMRRMNAQWQAMWDAAS